MWATLLNKMGYVKKTEDHDLMEDNFNRIKAANAELSKELDIQHKQHQIATVYLLDRHCSDIGEMIERERKRHRNIEFGAKKTARVRAEMLDIEAELKSIGAIQ